MGENLGGVLSALWLGILTSINPCPLAVNLAAVSFISRRITNPFNVFLSGLAYTVGRILTYTFLGFIIVSAFVSIPSVANLLQKYINQIIGPILILAGLFLLNVLKIKIAGLSLSPKVQDGLPKSGVYGAFVLGVVFAFSFCPASAGLFFGSLIPISVAVKSKIIIPFAYGFGTGLPVMVFSLLLALGVKSANRWLKEASKFEIYARKITGVIFILVGLYYTGIYVLRLF